MPNLTTSTDVDNFMQSADKTAMRVAVGVRDTLTANRIYYVRTDGSDSNNGLANTSGGAFLTWAKAQDVLASLDGGGFAATIKGTGSFTENVLFNKTFIGFSKIILEGDTTTPANCTLSPTSGEACLKIDSLGTPFDLQGLQIGNPSVFSGLFIGKGDVTIAGNCTFTGAGSHHIYVSGQKAQLNQRSNYSVSGNVASHIAVYDQGFMDANFTSSYTVTITGTPAFSTAFIIADRAGTGIFVNITYSGATTGQRYNIGALSRITAVGTTFPGSGQTVNALGSFS
jgi:hypothetical protein